MQLDNEMKSEQFEPLQSCDLKLPSIPKRSRLYRLEPIGIGTPLVESLTGYVTRLAEAHRLPTGILMSRELASLVDKIYVKRGASRGLAMLFHRANSLNSMGSMAMDLVQALESLTFRTNLRFLTMLTWAEILPTKGLFRTHKAWCTICYKDWLLAERVIYDPLIWMIDAVKICPRHHLPLSSHCLNCNQQLSLLTWHSRPGFCSSCGKWLGIISQEELFNRKRLSTDELNRQIWIVNSVGELLAAAPRLSSLSSKENVARSLHTVVNLVSEGLVD